MQFYFFSTDLQTSPVASFMQRHPKKTEAERIKSKALLHGAKEIMMGREFPHTYLRRLPLQTLNSYEINPINDN